MSIEADQWSRLSARFARCSTTSGLRSAVVVRHVVSSVRSLRSLLDHFRVAAARQPLRDESAGFLPLERPALELFAQLRGDHLEDPTTQDPQRLRVMFCSQFHQVCLRGHTLLSGGSDLV